MADLNVTIGADISAYKAGMQQAGQIAASTSNEITKDLAGAANASNNLGGSALTASMKFQQMRSGISAARDGLMGFTIGGQAGDRMLMAMGHHINSLVNETGSFSGAMKAMGSALLGPGGLILALTAAFELFQHFSKSESDAYDATKHFTDAADAQHAVVQNLDSSYGEAVKNVAELTENVKLAKEGFINKNEVVKEYNETLGKTMGAVKTLDEVEQKLVSGGEAYVKMMLYKAAAQTALKEASDKALEAAKVQLEDQSKFESIGAKAASFSLRVNTAPGFVPGASPIAAAKDQAEALKQFAEKERSDQIAAYKKDEDKLIAIADSFQAKAAEISGANKWNFFPDQKKDKVKEAVTGLDLLIQKAKEAEGAFNDAVANNAMKPGSVSTSEIDKLRQAAETARIKVNEVKQAIQDLKLELYKQENIKEFGSVFPTAKPQAPETPELTGTAKTDMMAAQTEIDIAEAKKAVGAIVAANDEILSGVTDSYEKGLISLKTYLGQKYFLEESNLSKERSLYAEGTVEYGNYTNRMTNLTKQYDEAIKKANEPTKQQIAIIKELSHVIGSGLMNAFEQALSGTQSFVKAMGQFLLQLIEKLVAAAAAAAVLAVLLSATGFGAVANFGQLFGQLSGLSGLLGGGSSSGGAGSPMGFATGGIFTQPHVGMFAEAGPEAIVTPKHLADFAGVSQGQQQPQTLTMKLQGSDMLLFLNRATKTKSRTS